MNAPPLLLPSLQLRGIVRRIRGRLAAELVIFLLGVMGNHYGAIWWRYGFVSSFLSGERKGLPPISIRYRSAARKQRRLMMVLGNQSKMP